MDTEVVVCDGFFRGCVSLWFCSEVGVAVLLSTFSSLLLAWLVVASSVLGVSSAVVVSTAGASF